MRSVQRSRRLRSPPCAGRSSSTSTASRSRIFTSPRWPNVPMACSRRRSSRKSIRTTPTATPRTANLSNFRVFRLLPLARGEHFFEEKCFKFINFRIIINQRSHPAMRAVCLGGGPGGLYFAISLKRRDPAHEVVVIERNKPDDTFGWGVVLSDETLANLEANDAESAALIRESFVYWDDIAVHYRGETGRSGGHGFSGIARKRLFYSPHARARELGVKLQFETEAADVSAYADYDLIVGADGVNSRVRATHADAFKPGLDVLAVQ